MNDGHIYLFVNDNLFETKTNLEAKFVSFLLVVLENRVKVTLCSVILPQNGDSISYMGNSRYRQVHLGCSEMKLKLGWNRKSRFGR